MNHYGGSFSWLFGGRNRECTAVYVERLWECVPDVGFAFQLVSV